MTTLRAPVADRTDIYVTGRRVVATLIDGLILGGAYALLAAGSGGIHEVRPWHWAANASPMASLLYAAGAAAYYILMEGGLGRTLGKMVTGIRVVDENSGEVPGFGPATIRTVLRLVDGLIGYLVAYVVVLSSDRRQRLGDMAAHTLVIRD